MSNGDVHSQDDRSNGRIPASLEPLAEPAILRTGRSSMGVARLSPHRSATDGLGQPTEGAGPSVVGRSLAFAAPEAVPTICAGARRAPLADLAKVTY
jgi:hypothetical protein